MMLLMLPRRLSRRLKRLWLLLHENVKPHPAHFLYNSVVSEAQRGPVVTATDAESACLVAPLHNWMIFVRQT